jgi:hypothetical protein
MSESAASSMRPAVKKPAEQDTSIPDMASLPRRSGRPSYAQTPASPQKNLFLPKSVCDL